MAEKDVISEPEGSLENFPSGDIYNLSGIGDEETPPKNPSETEAVLIILGLGVLPDVIDFFSIGGLSFLSSALSWPITEYYFYQKNLKVPNVKNLMRWMNLGDAVPFLGVIPLKTVGLLFAIYIAWHPESKLAKGAESLVAATNPKAVAKKGSSWENIKQRVQNWKGRAKGEPMSMEEFAYAKDKSSQKDIYEEAGEGVGGIVGPERQARDETFGEIISTPPDEPPTETPSAQPTGTKPTSGRPAPKDDQPQRPAEEKTEKERVEKEIEERLGINEIERKIEGK